MKIEIPFTIEESSFVSAVLNNRITEPELHELLEELGIEYKTNFIGVLVIDTESRKAVLK